MASCAPVVYRRSERVDNPPQAANLPHIGLYLVTDGGGNARLIFQRARPYPWLPSEKVSSVRPKWPNAAVLR